MIPNTPSWAEIFEGYVNNRMAGLHVALPGIVVSYDATLQVADVRPAVQSWVEGASPEDDEAEDLPIIPHVPVIHPRGGGCHIHIPLVPGDGVLLVFLERDPSQWLVTGEVTTPMDRRLHDLAHAVALPGFSHQASRIVAPGAGVELANGTMKATLTSSALEVGGTSAVALASKIDTLGQGIANVAAQPPAPTLATLAAAVAAIIAAASGFTAGASCASTKLKSS